jgi:plastocyanin
MKLYKQRMLAMASVIFLLGLVLSMVLFSSPPARASRQPGIANALTTLYLPFISKPPAPVSVSLMNIAYNPQAITITVGTTVKWTNDESFSIDHSVTSGIPPVPDGKFDSYPPYLAPGQSFQFTFNTPGTFPYYCRIHLAMMTGTVTVIP